MPLPLLLDSNIMASVVRPEIPANKPVASAVFRLMNDGRFRPCVSEIVDYELRRKLLHLAHHRHQGRRWAREALALLDEMAAFAYVPLTTSMMRMAAEIWAQERAGGRPRAPEENLDLDVILAAQARYAGGQVITTNERHFRGIAEIFDWRPYLPSN
jgi:predicted nucleic acid-binding protein